MSVLRLDQPVSQSQFGALVGVSQQAISSMVQKGVLSPDGTLSEWLLAYCARLRTESAGRGLETQEELNRARIREATINANLKDLDYWERINALVAVDDVQRLLDGWAARAASDVQHAFEQLADAIKSKYGVTLEDGDIDGIAAPAFRAIQSYPKNLIDDFDAGSNALEPDTEAAA